MHEKGRLGWVLITEGIGADPNNTSGGDYTDLSTDGFGVIVRLNYGYGNDGTIPHSSRYEDFARRCGNFVQSSRGCHIWIIGNEMNLAAERPGGPQGQVITPSLYANCYRKCRTNIRSRPGRSADQVVIGAVGPWNIQTKYPGNERGDWVVYFADILDLLGNGVDGISLHTYTHGQSPDLISSNATMAPPFQDRHYHFRAYRDFMAAIPEALHNRPVYITETDQYGAWRDENNGWVRNAYREIDNWNQGATNQPIQALILFRWIIGDPNDPQQVGWAIENKPGVQDDFRDAMDNAYHVVLPSIQPDYLVDWLSVRAPTRIEAGALVSFPVTLRNDGARAWEATGTDAVRLAYRWIEAGGTTEPGHARTDLPAPVPAGETATIPSVYVRAPDRPGYYTLEMDLVHGTSGWFADFGSPTALVRGVQIGPRYRAAWLAVDAPPVGTEGETVSVPVRVRNEGAATWLPGGSNPFYLSYRWLDADRNIVVTDGLRTAIGREVPPLEEISLDASVQLPSPAGSYILLMDMVHEFVTWFQWNGSPVYETPVEVAPVIPAWAVRWIDYVGPAQIEVGTTGLAYVELQNTGSAPWPHTGEDAVRLGYRWLDAQDAEVAVAGAEPVPLPRRAEPGDTVAVRDVPLVPPGEAGAYRLVWDLVQDGVWLSERGASILERAVQVVAPVYGVAWDVLAPWPSWVPPAAVQEAGLRLTNIGSRPWPAGGDHPVQLAYTWFTAQGTLAEPWDTFRFPLPADVPPGASVDLLGIPFQTPPVLGDYLLRWDLVEEGVTWFFRQGAAPLEVPLEVSDRVFLIPWQAQASHNRDDVALAFDGQPDTVWDSGVDQAPGQWFAVDMGQVIVLDRVRVTSPGRGFPLGYRILLSEDGATWCAVAEAKRNWTNIDAGFPPRSARYMRIEQTSTAQWSTTWMIAEIAVAAALPWAGATASHYPDDAHEAIDSCLDTAWNTRSVKQKPDMWFEVNMDSPRRIEGITLRHPASQMPRGYVMRVSSDAQNWQEVGRDDDNWATAEARFSPLTARYIRVETTNSSPYHPWGITEFVVWRASPIWLVGRQT
ncbi:MAG: discoidin domain-containing protein [Anaerolineae bacterium]